MNRFMQISLRIGQNRSITEKFYEVQRHKQTVYDNLRKTENLLKTERLFHDIYLPLP